MQKSVSELNFLPIELRCLIGCCQQEPNSNEINLILDNIPLLESKRFMMLAKEHGVLPVVYQTIKNYSIKDQLLDSTIDSLKQQYLLIAQNNMFMSAELLRLSKLFETNGLEMIAFKGPALAQEGYGDITLRQFGDLDILVKKADRFKAITLLIQEGYLPEIVLKKQTKTYFYHAVNVLGLHNPNTNLLIEVHWELLSKTYAIHWEEKVLWNTKHSLLLNHQTIWTLSPEHHLLYLCIHGAKHLFERLEWINDISRFINAHPLIDWEYLVQEAIKLRTKRMLLLGLSMAKTVFKTKIPPVIEEQLKQDKKVQQLTAILLEVHFPQTILQGKNISYPKILWAMRENPIDRLRLLWHTFGSPTIDDFKFIQLPGCLSAFYPFIRVYRLLKKYF